MGVLEGEVALIAGGGAGIGRAVVDRYVAEGARVAVMDITQERLDEIAAAHGDRVVTVRGDVTSLADNKAAVEAALSTFGRLDVLVCNAGITDGFRDLVDVDEATLDAAFDEMFAINVKGYVFGAKAALPALVASRGSIILTLSNSSFYPNGGGVLYVASKYACHGVLVELAHELAPLIRVNGVSPGATRTGIRMPRAFAAPDGEAPRADTAEENTAKVILDATPLAHWADPTEHTGAYVFLANRADNVLITGDVIRTESGLGVRGLVRVRGGDDLAARVAAD